MKDRAEAPKNLPGWVWGGLIGCAIIMSWMGWNETGAQKKLREAFGGESHLQCVRNASRVYATRLGVSSAVEVPQRLEDFVAIAEPIEVSHELSKRFQSLLTSSSSYYWGNEKSSCAPLYGYRLRFVCDDTSLEALISLRCGVVEFVADGKRVGGGSLYRPIEAEVKQLSIELFPGDREIEEAVR
jgi:hypothetical protein